MKTAKNLFPKISNFDNLLLAARKAQRGKRYKPNVAKFNFNLENEILQLQAELENETYQAGSYKTFYITDPKQRMISAAPYRDRVVHHALCNVIEPIFERSMIFDTYANRQGKGSHAAIRRCQAFARQHKYYLKCDIRKYFPSIDHAILKRDIRKQIGCAKTLRLIDHIIDNSNPQEAVNDYFEGEDLFTVAERRRGLPMGNLTSQFFANIYLSAFDHFVKEELRLPYVRYVDDFICFHDDKTALHTIQNKIEVFLTQYRLRIHPTKRVIAPTEGGMTYLGQRIFTNYRLLKKENVRRFYQRTKKRLKLLPIKRMTALDLENQLNSWVGHAQHADTKRLQKKIIYWLRAREVNVLLSLDGVWRVL